MQYEFVKEIGSNIPIPSSYKDVRILVQSDYYRFMGRKASWLVMFCKTLIEPSFAFLFWHRISALKRRNPLYIIAKILHRHYMFKYSLLIPSSTKIGYGLYLGHPSGIIINHTAIIGNNVNLSQFTTIGSNEGKAAIIGDDVYIGPSCCLIEDVKIGAGVTIGAGAIVTKDIPEGAVAVGNPAKVLQNTKNVDYINNKWRTEYGTTI